MATLGEWTAESGDFTGTASTSGTPAVVTSPVIFGTYVYDCPATTPTESFIRLITGLNKDTLFARAYVRVNVVTNPTTDVVQNGFMLLADTGATSGGRMFIEISTAGVIQLWAAQIDGTQIGSHITINENQTYLIEMKVVRHASAGVIEWKLDGVVQASSGGLNTGATAMDRYNVHGTTQLVENGGAGNVYWDQLALSDSGYFGPFGGLLPKMMHRLY